MQTQLISSARACTPPSPARHITEAEQSLLDQYTASQTNAFLQLYRLAQRNLGTGGGDTAAKVLLGLYNGRRVPLNLTELRRLDVGNLAAAMHVHDRPHTAHQPSRHAHRRTHRHRSTVHGDRADGVRRHQPDPFLRAYP